MKIKNFNIEIVLLDGNNNEMTNENYVIVKTLDNNKLNMDKCERIKIKLRYTYVTKTYGHVEYIPDNDEEVPEELLNTTTRRINDEIFDILYDNNDGTNINDWIDLNEF